jgi:hypothetical protein
VIWTRGAYLAKSPAASWANQVWEKENPRWCLGQVNSAPSILTRNATGAYLYLIATANESECTTSPIYCFSAESCENIRPAPIGRRPSVARTGNPLLLVDRRREPAARFYLSTGGSLWGISGSTKQGLYMQNFEVWFLLVDNEPISESHFSSFL